MSPSRLEAFSDGVIAIAITLLVLDIHVPAPGRGRLGQALAQQWPSYAAYVVSFLTIGIIWINHHAMIGRLRAIDHPVMMLNLLLLLTVGALPFSTALMSSYLRERSGQHLAAAVYGAAFVALSCAFYSLHRYVLTRGTKLLKQDIPEAARAMILRRNRAGLWPYLVATAVAPLSAYATFIICGAVAVYYALPTTTSEPGGEA